MHAACLARMFPRASAESWGFVFAPCSRSIVETIQRNPEALQRVSVLTDHHFLHYIHPREFLDSPEFESTRSGVDDKFKVSILAVTPCRYLFWQRSNLEYLLIKEPQLATVVSLLIARDITSKLYAMNEKIVTEKGSHLDIRLPSVTGSMTYRGQLSSSSQANSITCSLNAYKYNEVYTSQQTLVRETKKRLRRSRKWKASSE